MIRKWLNASLVFAVLVSSLIFGDLAQRGDNRVHLSEAAGNRLVKYRVQARCPEDSCTGCANAEVILKLVVGKNGMVNQVTIVRSPTTKLAKAASNAVRQWRYEPYLLNGTPAAYETYTTMRSWMCGA